MSALLELIRRTDDDYLAGLTNKGTVKRAYKDLEQASPAVSFEGEDARVTLSDAVCLIKAPLGESTCSCPSRSICRHIVTAILWLKKQEMPAEGEEMCIRDRNNRRQTALSYLYLRRPV